MASSRGEAPTDSDRRRFFRAEVSGQALVHAPDGALRCAIGNLSMGGALLLRSGGTQAAPPDGAPVAVELRVDGAGWVQQPGFILRCYGPQGPIAIAFGPLAPEVQHMIEDEIVAALEALRSPRVVLVDRSSSRRCRLASSLTSAGFSPIESSTPLEALDVIEQSRNHVAVAAIHESLTQTGGWELVRYLADAHPRLKIALITDDEAGEARLSARRGEVDVMLCADGRCDLSEPIRRLIGRNGVIAA